MNHDPRLGLPSASSFSLDALCPGRRALLASMTDIPEPEDGDANRGTKLHAAWEKNDPTGLDVDDLELYEQGVKLAAEAKAQWQMAVGQVVEGKREERFYFHSAGELAASGQADRHYIQSDRGLVLDFKSLWCSSLVPSELNWQLLLLAVCCAREYDLNWVQCSFVKPMFRQLDSVVYGPDDLKRAEFAIEQVLWASKHLVERRAGPHCRHCKAATACPEAKAYCLLPSVQSNALEGIKPKDAGPIVEQLDLRDCVRIWETMTSRHNIEEAIKVRLKALSPETQAELGIALGEPKMTRTITDPYAAFNFLLSVGIPSQEIWKAVKFGNTELANVLRSEMGLSSTGALAYIRETLKDYIEERPCERPLKKLKE
jgi:Protein of unknown function (DUF2800)